MPPRKLSSGLVFESKFCCKFVQVNSVDPYRDKLRQSSTYFSNYRSIQHLTGKMKIKSGLEVQSFENAVIKGRKYR